MLAGVEVCISGSIHACLKHRLLRDKSMEHTVKFEATYVIANRISIPLFAMCSV